MNCSAAIQILPFDEDDNSQENLHRIVDEVIDYIKSTGVVYEVGPFETSLEGDFDKLMDIAKKCQQTAIQAGAKHTLTYFKFLYKPDGNLPTIEEKVVKHR